MEDPQSAIITKVPANLKKLVRVTARTFYQPMQVVCLDVLTKYPCVTEADLVDVLQMQGSQRQLRHSLHGLRKDKLVKWLQKMECQDESGGAEVMEKHNMRMVQYYYINYKQFVNVVKCKLHQMRMKLEDDDSRTSRSKTSYVCSNCQTEYSDLDVDRLIDPTDEILKLVVASHWEKESSGVLVYYLSEGFKAHMNSETTNCRAEKFDGRHEWLRTATPSGGKSQRYLTPFPRPGRGFSEKSKLEGNRPDQGGRDRRHDCRVDASDKKEYYGWRCLICRTVLKEEEEEVHKGIDSRTQISQLNEYVKPITDLLKETESLNLAPELLEPEAQSIQKYLNSKGIVRRTSTSGKEIWNRTSNSPMNMYGDNTVVSVNIGEDINASSKTMVAKERPEWMTKSTVHAGQDHLVDHGLIVMEQAQPAKQKTPSETDRQIMEDLMAHEMKQSSSKSLSPPLPQTQQRSRPIQHAHYSSSSSSEDDDMKKEEAGGVSSSVAWVGEVGFSNTQELDDGKSSEDEGYTIRVGDKVVSVDQVTDDMVAQMTEEEKERYTEVYRMNMDDDDF